MNIAAQLLPFVLVTIYLALGIFLIVLAVRFVTAHERIASALESAAHGLHRSADEKKAAHFDAPKNEKA